MIAFALCGAVYWLRLDEVVGLFVDDGWYVLLAKALAEGHGYTLINSPSPGILPLYPPGFPWLLSLVVQLSPQFPQNLWLLKSVSVAAMLGVGLGSFLLARRAVPTALAMGVGVAVVTMPGAVFLATSAVMSDPVFACVQLCAVLLIERAARSRGRRGELWWSLGGAACASFAFLTRSFAVALLAAAVLYLLKERRWRAALVFVGVVALCVGPWTIYARRHAPTPAERAEQNSYIVESYGEQFWSKRAGVSTTGRITVRDLPDRVWRNVVDIFGRDLGGLLLPSLYRPTSESGQEMLLLGGTIGQPMVTMGATAGTIIFSLIVSLLASIGFAERGRARITLSELVVVFSLGTVILWLGWLRFLLPLAPFLLIYILLGLKRVQQWGLRFLPRMDAWTAARVLLLCVVAFNAYDHIGYWLGERAARPGWLAEYDEQRALIKWAGKELPPDAVIATSNPPLVHLLTGRATVGCDNPAQNWELWKRLGVRYLVFLAASPVRHAEVEQRFRVPYRSPSNFRVIDLGPSEARPDWP